MIIKLYNNKSPDNKIGKELELLKEYEGNLTSETSMMNFKLRLFSVGINNIKKANYLYIEELGRYYFITDINLKSKGAIELSCVVDVLESYKSEIKANTVLTKRQENYNNRYLNDDLFKIYQNPLYLIREFPNSFSNESRLLTYIGS